MTHAPIIHALEQAIKHAVLDLYLVPMVDEFQSEYIPASAARLPYITGFDGSAGLGVFWAAPDEKRRHTLFVDGRYTIQAAQQVDAAVIEVINSGDVSFLDWLSAQSEKLRVGVDPWLVTEAQREGWAKATAAQGVIWVAHPHNLVDSIWKNRPAQPSGMVKLHDEALAGASYTQKREAILATLRAHHADTVLLSQPDGINWLLNIRGSDVPFNPLLLSQMLLRADGSATLFMHPHALENDVAEYLRHHQVTIVSLADAVAGKLSKTILGEHVMMDPSTTAMGWFALAEKLGVTVLRGEDPTTLPKALKNPVELAGIRSAHVLDGLALTRFLHWFDSQTSEGRYPDELTVASTLEQFRAEDARYCGPSFATIAGSGPNGAIVHYRADAKSNRKSRVGELFLLDSGGQYPSGTTDVTRTLFVASPAGGTPAPEMSAHYTRVLKGHIALARARFPVGTNGSQLDVLARQYLWEAGLDYDHGTGHGVGAYLCVHEGPQRISKRGGGVALQPGMILSNEPGYYAVDRYGIRIENLVVVVAVTDASHERPMLGFETLTLAPIDTRLVTTAMLTIDERNWLNAYHRRVYDTHQAALDSDARRWLMQATRAI